MVNCRHFILERVASGIGVFGNYNEHHRAVGIDDVLEIPTRNAIAKYIEGIPAAVGIAHADGTNAFCSTIIINSYWRLYLIIAMITSTGDFFKSLNIVWECFV